MVLGLSAFGMFGVFPIAWRELTTSHACPSLGPMPACYVVLVGYLLIFISALTVAGRRLVLFASGWLPLFVLALIGSSMEILGHATCPRTGGGIPACYLSLALLFVLLAFFLFGQAVHTQERNSRN